MHILIIFTEFFGGGVPLQFIGLSGVLFGFCVSDMRCMKPLLLVRNDGIKSLRHGQNDSITTLSRS